VAGGGAPVEQKRDMHVPFLPIGSLKTQALAAADGTKMSRTAGSSANFPNRARRAVEKACIQFLFIECHTEARAPA